MHESYIAVHCDVREVVLRKHFVSNDGSHTGPIATPDFISVVPYSVNQC